MLSGWLGMEREDCLPYSIGAVILSPVPLNKVSYKHNPIIHNTIRIWKQMGKHFKLRAFLLPISTNPSFAPSNMDGTFNIWRELGICNIGDLYIKGTFAFFQQRQERYNLPRNHFFRYLQIRDYVRVHLPNFENARPDKLDGCLRLFCRVRTYNILFI